MRCKYSGGKSVLRVFSNITGHLPEDVQVVPPSLLFGNEPNLSCFKVTITP